MRCRECGMEMDARDRLPNGAYQCPECGAIHHTASSSKVSPSPWRRKRKTGLAAVADALTQRKFGLPLWLWAAIALVLIVVIIVLALSLGGGRDSAEPPAANDAAQPQATAQIEASTEPSEAGADGSAGATLPDSSQAPSTDSAARSTGVAPNDFTVGFEWAMANLNYAGTLAAGDTQTGPGGESIQNYSFGDWFVLRLTVDPGANAIRSLTATAQLEAGSTDNVRALAGMVCALYGLDNTITAGAARRDVEAMVADNSRSYDRDAFSATLASSETEYALTANGKL